MVVTEFCQSEFRCDDLTSWVLSIGWKKHKDVNLLF